GGRGAGGGALVVAPGRGYSGDTDLVRPGACGGAGARNRSGGPGPPDRALPGLLSQGPKGAAYRRPLRGSRAATMAAGARRRGRQPPWPDGGGAGTASRGGAAKSKASSSASA